MDKFEQNQILDLFGELEDSERAALERQLDSSAELRTQHERLRAVIEHYRGDAEDDPPEIRIGALEKAPSSTRGWSWPRAASRVAALLLVSLASFLVGRSTSPPDQPPETSRQIQALVEQTASLRRSVVLLGLQQENVAARIAAIEDLGELDRDPLVAQALQKRLRDDRSVNARLAALDVLYRAPELAPRPEDMLEIMAREPNLGLRLALLDWIAAARQPGWQQLLERTERTDEDQEVRSRARALLGARS